MSRWVAAAAIGGVTLLAVGAAWAFSSPSGSGSSGAKWRVLPADPLGGWSLKAGTIYAITGDSMHPINVDAFPGLGLTLLTTTPPEGWPFETVKEFAVFKAERDSVLKTKSQGGRIFVLD